MRLPKRRIGETALSQHHVCARSIRKEIDDGFGVAGAAVREVRAPSPTEGEPSGSVDLGENSVETVIQASLADCDGNASAGLGIDRRSLDPLRTLWRQEPTRPRVGVGPKREDRLSGRGVAAFDAKLRKRGECLRPGVAHRLDPGRVWAGQDAKTHGVQLVALDLCQMCQDFIEVVTRVEG